LFVFIGGFFIYLFNDSIPDSTRFFLFLLKGCWCGGLENMGIGTHLFFFWRKNWTFTKSLTGFMGKTYKNFSPSANMTQQDVFVQLGSKLSAAFSIPIFDTWRSSYSAHIQYPGPISSVLPRWNLQVLRGIVP